MLKDYLVKDCNRKEIEGFIEKWHYSHSINGVKTKYCFKLVNEKNDIVGAIIYAGFGMANVWRKYAEEIDDVVELRRLCCVDDTPKNTESFFISKTLLWLKKNTKVKTVISYADETYGHKGTVYKASNFKFLGTTKPVKLISFKGKLWHDKTIRTKHNGKLKPYAQKLKDALDKGEAKFIMSKCKYIYRYDINRKV